MFRCLALTVSLAFILPGALHAADTRESSSSIRDINVITFQGGGTCLFGLPRKKAFSEKMVLM